MPSYLEKLRSDPRVQDISDERDGHPDGGDGIWVYLREGYDSNVDPFVISTSVHEWNIKDLRAAMKQVTVANDPKKIRE